jgi:hypothetical protein
VKGHSCDAPNWLRAKGTKNWSFKPKRKLPPGHYVLYARATSEKAVSGVALSKKNKNRVELTVR